MHQEALKALWYLCFPDVDLHGLVTEQWKQMGWQGNDPSTDFRFLENHLYFYITMLLLSLEKIQMLSVSVQFWQGWRIYFPGKFTLLCKEISGMYVCVCIYSNSLLKFFITVWNIILPLTYIRTPVSLEDTCKSCPICTHPYICIIYIHTITLTTHTHTDNIFMCIYACIHLYEIYIHANTLVTHTHRRCVYR